jgi:hypothetical protein
VTTLEWTCARCGEVHRGVPFDWAWDRPLYWDGPRAEDDSLSSDLCIWTDDDGVRNYFVRGVIEIPVHDADADFAYGVWSSLSEASFTRVVALWDDPERVHEPPYFGWLSNRIPGYPDTVNLKTNVVTASLELRPSFLLEPTDHPLAIEQREGITLDRVHEIAELNLHAA